MHELFIEILGHVKSAMRFKWLGIMIAWPICLFGWLYVSQMPDEYGASARVHVDTDSVLKPLLQGLAIHPNLNQQVRLMTKLMFSRPNLEKVARMTDLDLKAKDSESMEALIEHLADSMKIVGEKNNLFTITAEDDNPETAKRTVQALLTIFVEETLGNTRDAANAAGRFLNKEIKEHESRLQVAERSLEDFKRKNHGLLPQQGNNIYGTLQSTTLALENAKLSLQEATNRRNTMAGQLKNQPGFTQKAKSTEDLRIQALVQTRDKLLLRYTENHPEVRAIDEAITTLEVQSKSDNRPSYGGVINPVYLEMKTNLVEASAAVAALQARVSNYQERINKLNDDMGKRLRVETDLQSLNRDYSITKKNYDELVTRREQAQLSKSMEMNTDTVKFRIVDPPRVPEEPAGPKRVLFSTLVFLAALTAGIGIALVLSLLRPSFFSTQKVREVSGLPVLGAVSMSHTETLLQKERYDLAGFSLACISLVVVFSAVIVLELLGKNLHSFLAT